MNITYLKLTLNLNSPYDVLTNLSLVPRSYGCKFDETTCPATTAKKVHWRGTQGHKLIESAPGAVILSVKVKNNDKTWWDVRKNKYTGFLMVKLIHTIHRKLIQKIISY